MCATLIIMCCVVTCSGEARLRVRARIQELYVENRATAGGRIVSVVAKQIKKEYPSTGNPYEMVRLWMSRYDGRTNVKNKRGSGRPRLESYVTLEAREKCVEAVKRGIPCEDGVYAFPTGQGLLDCCPEAAQIAEKHKWSAQQLLTVLLRTDSSLRIRSYKSKKLIMPAAARVRQQHAEERLAMIERNPRYSDSIFMLDATTVWGGHLLKSGSGDRVLVSKDNDLAATPAEDSRITAFSKYKLTWMVMVNAVGGAGPLVYLTGTTGEEDKGYKVWPNNACHVCSWSATKRTTCVNVCRKMLSKSASRCRECSCCLPSMCIAHRTCKSCLEQSTTSIELCVPRTCHS